MTITKNTIYTYSLVFITLLLADAIWLGVISLSAYQDAIGFIMREKVKIWPASAFYVVYAAAIVFLAILPSRSVKIASLRGAVLGVAAYGTYNLTNYSIIADWPLSITLKDWLWGTFLTSTASFIGAWFCLRRLTSIDEK